MDRRMAEEIANFRYRLISPIVCKESLYFGETSALIREAAAVSLVLVLFINMYSETISKHQATLVELHENIEVTGYITGAEANQVEDLNLDADIIQDLEGSGFISRGLYTLNRVNVIHILTARE